MTQRLKTASLLLALAAGLSAPPALATAGDATAKLGGIEVTYDTSRWSVAPGEASDTLTFTCIAADCHHGATATLTARGLDYTDGASANCDAAPDRTFYRSYQTPNWAPSDLRAPGADFGGLEVHGLIGRGTCRARTAPALQACGVHAGVSYTISAGFQGNNCYFGATISQNQFLELLDGIHVVSNGG
jgi:hypothetical protein